MHGAFHGSTEMPLQSRVQYVVEIAVESAEFFLDISAFPNLGKQYFKLHPDVLCLHHLGKRNASRIFDGVDLIGAAFHSE